MTSFPMRNENSSKLFLDPFALGNPTSSQSKHAMLYKNYKHEIGEHFGINHNKIARTRRSFDWSVCKDRSMSEGSGDSCDSGDSATHPNTQTDHDVACKVATRDPWHVRCSRCCNCNSSIAIGNLIYETSFCSRLCLTSWKVARYKRVFEDYEKHESESGCELEAEVTDHRNSANSKSERVRHEPIDIPRHS